MNKTWHHSHDIAFSLEQANEPRLREQIQCIEPNLEEFSPSAEPSIQQLFEEPTILDHWIDLHEGKVPERVRNAHLFHDVGKCGGNPLLEGSRIYHGKISHIENTDRLRVWLRHPPRHQRVYFEVPHYRDDLLREWTLCEWQALLDGLERPDAMLFVVSSYYRQEWHTMRYLASSPSLIRIR